MKWASIITDSTGRLNVSPRSSLYIFVYVLCSRFLSAICPENQVTQVMGVVSRGFLRDAKDNVNGIVRRSKERVC